MRVVSSIGLSLAIVCAAVSAPNPGAHDGADGDTAGVTAAVEGASCVAAATSAGDTALCASCACGSCTAATAACAAAGQSCTEVTACERRAGCTGDSCYCGTGFDSLSCIFKPKGPCVAEIEAAIGGKGLSKVWTARNQASSPLARAEALVTCSNRECAVACAGDGVHCELHDLSCQQRYCGADDARRRARRLGPGHGHAAHRARHGRRRRALDGRRLASRCAPVHASCSGQRLRRRHDVDFSKILIGNVRALESDLAMYEQTLDIASQVHSETPTVRSNWPKDVAAWTDTRVEFTVPRHVTRGPLRLQVQKRFGQNSSYVNPARPTPWSTR